MTGGTGAFQHAVDDFDRMLASKDAAERIRACHRARRLDVPRQREILLKLLRDRSTYVAALAAHYLEESAGLEEGDRLLETYLWLMADGLKRDPGCHIRNSLAICFGRLRHTAAVDALRSSLTIVQIEPIGGQPYDTAAHLRGTCALSLSEYRDVWSIPDIAVLLFQIIAMANGVRKAAATALGRMCDASAITPLVVKLRLPALEPDPDVLMECMTSLAQLEAEHLQRVLVPYLQGHDDGLAACALITMANAQLADAPELIVASANRLTGAPLAAAVLGLVGHRSDNAGKALLELSSHERSPVRAATAAALARRGGDSCRAALKRLTEDEAAPVREAALRELEVPA
ncbi:MAG: hypothetical protein KGJ62_07060 [Armatimonadetes bacterium]|nr:hypothetical protein [Armatimonadota bacterium]MDE2207307.1 hypothetical protein [Armatimonadota bacterium]